MRFPRQPIDDHVQATLLKDLRRAVAVVKEQPGRKVRLLRLPVEILEPACRAISAAFPYQPFTPTCLGIPCDLSVSEGIDIVTVTDTRAEESVQILDHTGKPALVA